MHIHLDFETRHRSSIKDQNPLDYARTCDVICVAYKTNNDPVKVVRLLKDGPAKLKFARLYHEWAAHGATFHAWNAAFEMNIISENFKCSVFPEQWRCTMAKALHMGLPASLAHASPELCPDGGGKDMGGRSLMLKMCKPNNRGEWLEDEPSIARLMDYCAVDVEVEYGISSALPPMPPSEQKLWELDRRMNRRGVKFDLDFAKAAVVVRDRLLADIDADVKRITNGAVSSVTEVGKISAYCAAQGYPTSVNKQELQSALADKGTPANVRAVLEARAAGGKTSLAKFPKIVALCDAEGITNDFLAFHAAGTGRWGGRGIQLHNFARPELNQKDIDDTIQEVKALAQRPDISPPAAKTLSDMSSCLRAAIIPHSSNSEFIVTDYAAIEARLVGWVSHCNKLTKIFADYDNGVGDEPYIVAARIIYGNPSIKDKKTNPNERACGKFGILGCGYGMGPAKAEATMTQWGVKNATPELANRVVHEYYRTEYPEVVAAWKALETAWRSALYNPDKPIPAHRCVFLYTDSWMRVRLPSGSVLSYFEPRIVDGQLEYKGVQINGGMGTEKMYGGRLMENICQRLGRDLLKDAMLRLEPEVQLSFHVHDELIVEAEATEALSVQQRVVEVIKGVPAWAAGLPVECESTITRRYGK